MITFNDKGQIRTLEAFLAAVIISSTLVLSSAFSPEVGNKNPKSLKTLGMQALIELDFNGSLGSMVQQEEWVSIGECLAVLLPIGISYNLTVYNDQLQIVNSVPISNGDLVGQSVESIQYVCATQNPNPEYYLLQLQLTSAR
ncbi:MAG: hypothetical protein JSW53_02645 [Candidatus Bathyarchaeota archaeon]|nr:MAG: hypothetical protein JSW53_02645 [Candidatus Bathyarchaeota archaeon]